MRAPRNHPLVLFFARRHRLLLHLLLVVTTVLTLFPRARPAYAAAATSVEPSIAAQAAGEIDPCDLIPIPPGVNCTNFPPPELLYLQSDIYYATPAQTASLRNLENRAVQDVITLHSLPPEDEAAVRTWGRDAVLSQLYILLAAAINTEIAERTVDEQSAVDWLTSVAQRRNVAAAQNAAREYVKWAGLGRSNFDALMSTNPSKAQIEAFLSGPVVNYDFPGGTSTEGWCVYRSPAPYESEYTGYNNPLCLGPVLGFILPPTPSYDQFVEWGSAKANYPLLSSPAFLTRAQTMGVGLGIGLPLSAVAAGAAPITVALRAVKSSAEGAKFFGDTAKNVFSVASRFSIVAGVTVFLTVITALVTAVLLGINVADAANLPGKLAALVDTARTTSIDATTLTGDTDSTTNLFSLFVGATTPMPTLDRSCDNSNITPGFLTITIIGTDQQILSPNTPCLNPTRIPAAAATDPQFVVKNASGVEVLSPTISVKDSASDIVTTARLSGNWFITSANGTTAQTLRLAYTDWEGNQQSAWLTGTPTDGYAFLTAAVDSSETTAASTCIDDGTCSAGATIEFIGADDQPYSATVRAYQAPTGTPTVSNAEESIPAILDAGGFAPGGAVEPVTYRWSFKGADCALVIGLPCSELGNATGSTVTFTWDAGGTYQVDLTATDAIGAQATTSLQVSVASLPPAFAFAPDCAASPNVPCNTWGGNAGSSVALRGTLRYTGSASRFQVTVDWGDGSSYFVTIGSDGSVGTIPPGGISPIAVTRVPGELAYTLVAPFTYVNPGIYNGSVRVTKLVNLIGDGGTVTQPFTMNIKGNQTISFPSIGGTSYGNLFSISATGGASGQPVTFTSNSLCALSDISEGPGTGSATVTVLGAGECTITARQAGSATYNPAPEVTRRIISLLALLTVTAPSPTITYGQPVPALTPDYSGFKLSDSESILTTPATCVVAPNSGGVGSYATSCSGTVAPNYSVDYVPGTLTITRAPLTITANNKTMVYGQAVPSFDATFSGLVNGESSSVVSGLSCSARDGNGQPISSITPPGSYPITCDGGSTANYSLSYVAGTLTINKAATTTTLSAAPNTSLLGQSVTFTAAVAVNSLGSGTPGGAVTFLDGSIPIAGCSAVPINPASGTATCTTSTLSVGQRAISASYSGDANFAASSATPASYTVAYGFSSFSGPVDNPPMVNSASAGRSIPLKWRIVNAAGAPITNLSSVTVTSAAGGCSANVPADPVEEYAITASGLQNLGDGYYQFNWKTERAWAGSCRTLRLNLGDGVVRTALFQFR